MTKTTLGVSIVLEHRVLENRWATEQWAAVAVLPATAGEVVRPRRLRESASGDQWLYDGLCIELFTDEAENYLLNVSGAEPKVFVMWRREGGEPLPQIGAVTVSFGEAARMLDSGEQVDGVAMPAAIREWVERFARTFYRPEVRRKGGRFASVRDGSGHGG